MCSYVVVFGLSYGGFLVIYMVAVVRELFVLGVSILRECEGDGNDGVRDVGGVVVVSAVNENLADTCGSGIVSSAADMLGMRGVVGCALKFQSNCSQ